jgi:sugar lactone lactonase YvrE
VLDRRWLLIARAGGCMLLIAGLLGLTCRPTESVAGTPPAGSLRVVADHLDNPRGLFVSPSGTLWAAVAGRGGGRCANQRGRICWGRTGRLLEITSGAVHTFASRLASIHDYLGVLGADDVSVAPDGSVFTAMITDEGELPERANSRWLRGELGKLLRFDGTGRRSVQANLLDDAGGLDFGHPYGILALPGRELVVDSEQNELIEVRGARVRVVFHFPSGAHGADSVPTSLAEGPGGAIYIGELSGDRAGLGHARIWRMLPGQRPKVLASGFNAITGIAVGSDGSVYVCEYSLDYAAGDEHGDVVRLDPDGTRTQYGAGELFHPGGVAVASDGTIYVSNWSTLSGRSNAAGERGQIVAITPAP